MRERPIAIAFLGVLLSSLFLVACSGTGGTDAGSRRVPESSEPTAIAPGAPYSLPRESGRPFRDPAAQATSPRQVLKPGARVVLTTPVMRLLRKSVEGTMAARVDRLDTVSREAVVRVISFEVPYLLSMNDRPAVLTLPPGTLVRLRTSAPGSEAPKVPLIDLVPGRTVTMKVRFDSTPAGTFVTIVSTNGERGPTR